LRSAIRRHHPPQRAVLSQICCFGERKMVMFQILLDGAEPCDAETTQLSSAVYRYVTGKSSRSHTEMIYPPADGHPSQRVCRIEQLR